MRRAVILLSGLVAAATVVAGTGGCGFVDAGSRSPGKPDTVLVRGRVVVPLADDTRPEGSACAAPATASDIASGAPVRVSDESGRALARGHLGLGVVAVSGGTRTCDFPFEVPGVPGGHRSVDISVAGRPGQQFALRELAEDRPAVLTVTP